MSDVIFINLAWNPTYLLQINVWDITVCTEDEGPLIENLAASVRNY